MTTYTQRKIKYYLKEAVFHTGVLILAFLMLYPILWMISNSFKTNREIFTIFAMGTLSLIPVFLIFIVFQKHIVEGMVTTGIKG